MSGRQRVLEQGLEQTAGWVRDNARFVEWIRPDGGALCCVRLKRTAFDDEAVRRFYAALPLAGVRVAPGTWFGEEERVFRLGFGAISSSDLDAALTALTKVLNESAYAQAA